MKFNISYVTRVSKSLGIFEANSEQGAFDKAALSKSYLNIQDLCGVCHETLGEIEDGEFVVVDNESTSIWQPVRKTAYRIRREVWMKELEKTNGNIAAAARENGFARSYGKKLTNKLGLQSFAANLRIQAWGYSSGRPKRKVS